MNKNDAPPAKIRYKYEMAPEARLQTAHGVWGGINPQGEIEMNFYHESDCLPAYSERLITPDGSIGAVFYQAKIFLQTSELLAWTVVVVAVSVAFEKFFMFLLRLVLKKLKMEDVLNGKRA